MIDEDDVFAGRILRNYRKLDNITQKMLADAIGVSFQQIQKYETGKNRISVSTLAKICRVLEVEPNQFFEEFFR